MGMQVSRGVHPEVSQEEHLRVGAQRVRSDHTRISPTERSGGGGRAFDARSCAHVVVDTAEVFGIRGGGIYQGEERDSDRSAVYGSSEELCGAEFWARGYYVSTVGRDEEQIRNYIKEQEKEDKRLDQLKMFD